MTAGTGTGKSSVEFCFRRRPSRLAQLVGSSFSSLGGVPGNARRDTPEFEAVKREVMKLPVVKKGVPRAGSAGGGEPTGPPPPPSTNSTSYQNASFSLQYPDNWKQFGGDENGATFGPEGGVVNDGSGHGALQLVLDNSLPWAVLLGLIASKGLASAVSVGAGFRGGLFSSSLLLGAVSERRGDLDAAAASYDEAATLVASPQSARLASAYVAHLRGRRTDAADAVMTALANRSDDYDPWWSYTWGYSIQFERLRRFARELVKAGAIGSER